MLILLSWYFAEFISCSSFCVEFLEFSIYSIISFTDNGDFISSFQFGYLLFLFLVWFLWLGLLILCWIEEVIIGIHGHHQMANTEIRLIIFFAVKDREALYSQQKQDQELTVGQIMNSLLPNSDLNWRKWGKPLDHSGMT